MEPQELPPEGGDDAVRAEAGGGTVYGAMTPARPGRVLYGPGRSSARAICGILSAIAVLLQART